MTTISSSASNILSSYYSNTTVSTDSTSSETTSESDDESYSGLSTEDVVSLTYSLQSKLIDSLTGSSSAEGGLYSALAMKINQSTITDLLVDSYTETEDDSTTESEE